MKSTLGYFGFVCMMGCATTTEATITARASLEVASPRIASAVFATSRTSNVAVTQRHLQGTCSSDAVTISMTANSSPSDSSSPSSSRFAAFAGCYQDTGLVASQLPYYTPSGLDLPQTYIGALDIDATSSNSSSTFARWVMGDHESDLLACASNEPADSVHPGDATWFCSRDDSGNELVSASTECGGNCANSDPGETTCTSETISVVSSAFPSFEGCYEPTGEEAVGRPVYSKTGELVEGEPLILMSNLTEITGTEAVIWNLGLLVDTTVPTLSCISGPSRNIVHPSDALWSCDIDGDAIIGYFPSETADTPGLFAVNCGGSATTCADASSSSATDETTANPREATSSGSDAPPSTEDDSPDDGATTSTGGGVRLAASPASRVNGVLVGLVMAAGLGAYRVL